jgi:hypothetical protein
MNRRAYLTSFGEVLGPFQSAVLYDDAARLRRPRLGHAFSRKLHRYWRSRVFRPIFVDLRS